MVLAIGDLSSRCSPPRSPPWQHSSPVQVAYGNLCPIEIEVAVRLGWSGMASPQTTVPTPKGSRRSSVAAVPVACVMPVVTEFVTLLADFVTHSIG
jgi:hypothetical protein